MDVLVYMFRFTASLVCGWSLPAKEEVHDT